ncbi:DUF72 domain-containing protein [Alicyclobacillus sp.]|uniref:DUF72 domain-containing protein n=1 Tax=Alicyclobacillus sp. TaxID=61169 RepID=UPI0025BA0348|nr:DUF72 domain-containing protein [Alicyclobacillus sp.]MCL6516566.1 DUF72 domain-containing protein [Alicyclobacillus sp.]
MSAPASRILCGTCAWADHERFYPKGLRPQARLAYYARYFPVVEADAPYYHIPTPGVTARWVQQSPDGFVIDVKAHRTLTLHDRGQAGAGQRAADFAAFLAALRPLAEAGRLGAVLFQFPPWFVASDANRRYLDEVAERMAGHLLAVEFRHRSWWQDDHAPETLDQLRRLGAVNVVCDEPQVGQGTIPFVPDVTQPRLVVFRLHGRNDKTWYQKGLTSSQQRFDYLYTREELAAFLPHVRRWAEEASAVHILMNNNQGDYAIRNALDWLDLLGFTVRENPLRREEPAEQLRLFDFD